MPDPTQAALQCQDRKSTLWRGYCGLRKDEHHDDNPKACLSAKDGRTCVHGHSFKAAA